jgi:hypothetical protein
MHIKLEAIMLSALILIIMGFTCHFKSYLSESFTNTIAPIDPNKLYTRLPSGQIVNSNNNGGDGSNASTRFSRMYKLQMGGSNYNSKFCKSELKDPCPEILKQHSEVPADVVAQCKAQVEAVNTGSSPSPSPTGSSLQNFTDDEIQQMVRQYAYLTSQRNPQSPRDFNPYGSPAIDI